MTLDELYGNISKARFSNLVCQADIHTDTDAAKLQERGYEAVISAIQFSEILPLLPIDKIFYSPSLTLLSLYFNPETLAAVPVFIPQMLLLSAFDREKKQDQLLQAIEVAEAKMKMGDYHSSLCAFSNGMRLEYLERLSRKLHIPDLYKVFFSTYRVVDFGISAVSPEFSRQVFSEKASEDRKKTEAALQDMPDEIVMYRGGNTLSTPYTQAFSWTTDINIASFFAARQGNGPGCIVQAVIGKKDVVDYFPEYSEREIIVDPAAKSFQVQNVIEVKGLDYLDRVLPIVTPMFHRYRDELYRLDFAQKSAIHGLGHEARVLLMCLILANELKLPKKDVAVLCIAALYHDVRRDNDGEDMRHGAMGRVYYEKSVSKPDPLVSFLCEFHCLPDETGLERIKSGRSLGRTEEETIRLFNVFKDADALDRVRFGIQNVDMNQLRLGISRSMVLVARLVLQNLKV